MAAMTTILGWSDFERRRPDLAEAGRGLLYETRFTSPGVPRWSVMNHSPGPLPPSFLVERDIHGEPPGFADGEFFEFRLSRCLLTRTDSHGDTSPRHTVWAASA